MEFLEWNGGVRKEKKYKKALDSINRDLESFKKVGAKKSGLGKDYKKTIKWFEEEKARRQNKLNKQKKANKKYKKAYRAKILSNPTKLYKHRNEFNEDEIRKAMKTFHMDEELRNLSSNKKRSRLDTPKRLIAYGTTAIAAYGVAKKGKKIVDEILQNRKYKQMSLFD